mgnify:CR=1 FL=1
MSYRCKICREFDKDRGCDGWEALGWRAEDICGRCQDSDIAVAATSPLVQRLVERVDDLEFQVNAMIVRFQKRNHMARMKHCPECVHLTGRLAQVTQAWAKSRSETEEAYEQLARTLLGMEK